MIRLILMPIHKQGRMFLFALLMPVKVMVGTENSLRF